MHTLWVVLLVTRNKEVSNAIIGVVKLRLPFKIPLKYSGLGGGVVVWGSAPGRDFGDNNHSQPKISQIANYA